MTTIVIAHDCIAADSQLSGDSVKIQTNEKLVVRGSYVYGIAGNLAAGLKFVSWLERANGNTWLAAEQSGDCPLDDDTSVLEFNLRTGQTLLWEHPGWPLKIETPIAIGSGAAVAYGALYMGATAVQAATAACKYDDGSSGPVVYYSKYLDDEPRWV